MAKENIEAIKLVQKEFLKVKASNSMDIIRQVSMDSPTISPEKLKKFGIDITKKSVKLGNLILKKNMLLSDDYSINLDDKKKDLDGISLQDHPKLLKLAQNKWDRNEKNITYQEFWKLNIYTPLNTIKVGNLELSSGLLDGNNYSISLIDKNKDCHGRWTDKAVDHKNVLKALSSFKLTKSKYKTLKETALNSDIEKHFRTYFDNCNKSKGNLKGLFDLEIGNIKYVIEMKLASSAKKTDQRDRAYGQMKRYLDEFKSKNFMLLVAGEETDKQDPNIKSLKNAAEKEFGVNFYFLEAE